MENRRGFIETVFHEGNINTLLGPPGVGKSNFASFIMEKAVEKGFNAFTNIHFFRYSQIGKACNLGKLPKGVNYIKKPEEIHVVTKLSSLLIGLLENKKNIVFLDESGIFASSTAATSSKVRQLKELAYVIRHLNASLLLIAQAKGSIVPDLRKTLVTYEMNVDMYSQKYRAVEVSTAVPYTDETGTRDIKFVVVDTIGRIPLSRLPWDGFFIPKFEFDIKLSEAFNRLGEYDSIEVMDVGPKVIKELLLEIEEPKLTRRNDTSNFKSEIREQYLVLEDSGKYSSRSEIVNQLMDRYNRSFSFIYQIVSSMPFDKNKFKK